MLWRETNPPPPTETFIVAYIKIKESASLPLRKDLRILFGLFRPVQDFSNTVLAMVMTKLLLDPRGNERKCPCVSCFKAYIYGLFVAQEFSTHM